MALSVLVGIESVESVDLLGAEDSIDAEPLVEMLGFSEGFLGDHISNSYRPQVQVQVHRQVQALFHLLEF